MLEGREDPVVTEDRTNVDAHSNAPATCMVADQAVRFHQRFVERRGRREDRDRDRAPSTIDLVAPLVDGRVVSGAIKWSAHQTTIDVHLHPLTMLEHAGAAGRS